MNLWDGEFVIFFFQIWNEMTFKTFSGLFSETRGTFYFIIYSLICLLVHVFVASLFYTHESDQSSGLTLQHVMQPNVGSNYLHNHKNIFKMEFL